MCGIFCTISGEGYIAPSENAIRLLKQRGPDSLQEYKVILKNQANQDVFLSFTSSVLSLRGSTITTQPLVDQASRCVLCWNGEAWKIGGEVVSGNDSIAIFKLLVQAAEEPDSQSRILNIIENTRGPFAFVFYDAKSNKLYYGRDCLGRRSLLRASSTTGALIISSVADLTLKKPWFEVEPDGIHIDDLSLPTPVLPAPPDSIPFDVTSESLVLYTVLLPDFQVPHIQTVKLPYGTLNRSIPSDSDTRLNINSPTISVFGTLLKNSLALRVEKIREENDSKAPKTSKEPRVAILFSGGLDCTLLARLTHDLLAPTEPIDLLNVAFQNPRIHKDGPGYELCPDRITARSSFIELQQSCPSRDFRLVCIDVTYEESQEHRQQVIDLINPHNTEMDLSIAYALYFASKGQGQMTSSTNPSPPTKYTTPSRVLLSGLGADELFGGYQRHQLAFSRQSYPGLLDELELDINRLGKRNLGRDDRVISHNSREVRFPFLDEDVVAWTLQAPVWEKIGFGMDSEGEKEDRKGTHDDGSGADIEGGKLLLRLLACKLGMHGVAREKKRAIQFGARTAKMETGRTKGTQLLI